MPNSAVTTEIHQALYIHGRFPAQITFYGKLGDLFAQTAGIAGEVLIDLLLALVAGEPDLVGIDENDEIAAVHVRRIVGLVLAAKDRSDLATHAAYSLIGPVHNVPVALDGSCIGMLGGEM